ncbi:MAG: 2-oxo acid dehydrogenase subunit E2 [Bdellovibrionaceae bacterium]|nr:2-oxo acid dehydrogenase subunit E2 [Pseudobdellovibrionaceae bacterium]
MKSATLSNPSLALQEIIGDREIPGRGLREKERVRSPESSSPQEPPSIPPSVIDVSEDPQTITVGQAERTSWAMSDEMNPVYMVTMVAEIDASRIDELRARLAVEHGKAPSYTALVMKAAALTLQRHPEANRAILGPWFFRRLIQFSNIDISVAVEKSLPGLPGQAFAGTITNTADRSLGSITGELAELAQCTEDNNEKYRTFMGILRYVPRPFSNWIIRVPTWFASQWKKHRGCACWVNAPSKAGADLVMTTWPWPLTFSFGVVKKRPFVVGDKIEARSTMPLVMVFDRRVMGGGPAGRIFATFKQILETGTLE